MYLKRLLILFIITVTTVSLTAQDFWLSAYSPTNINLKKASFIDSVTGWVCGDSGLIMKTSNGGQNWTTQNTRTKTFIHDVFFLNSRLGWALGWNIFNPQPPYGSYILKTTNGGVDWDTSFFPIENVFLKKVYFQDSLYGFLGGNFKNILRTTDGGQTWLDVEIDSLVVMNFPVLNFSFYSKDYGYAVGGVMDIAGVIWRTSNRGQRWTPYIVSPEPNIDMMFFDSLNALGFGGDFEYGASVIKTTNAGENWVYESLELFGLPTVMSFRTLTDGWGSLGYTQTFVFTQDGGRSFTQINTPDSAVINDIVFPGTKHGYAFGEYGKMLRFNATTVGVGNEAKLKPKSFELKQNFPNPFNPYTTISYEINNSSYVVLKVFDISGKEIRTLQNGQQNQGKYNIKFNSSNLPSGVYFYRITIRDLTGKSNEFVSQTKKMLIVK
ncbi:MAG: YCF48-related protein [Ignavibacteria bacterium]